MSAALHDFSPSQECADSTPEQQSTLWLLLLVLLLAAASIMYWSGCLPLCWWTLDLQRALLLRACVC